MIEGLAEYRSFSGPEWEPPALDEEISYTRALLGRDDVWCLIAESGGALVGQVTVLPAADARDAVDEPGLAHLSNLFVDPAYWGTGLARSLHDAAVEEARRRSFSVMRLFVAAGQGRARRFYEREGWAPAGEASYNPIPRLVMVEYRRPLAARVLLLFERGLREFPVDLAGLRDLEVLDLNRNPELGSLPPLAALGSLRFLYAEELGLAEVPELPGSLEYLNVAHNRLTALPAQPLPHLRDLRAQGNPLVRLPETAFAGMPDLRALELSHTGLVALPESLLSLGRLRSLSLRGCALEELPDALDGLVSLRDLDLRANRLHAVPPALGELASLERVDLRWNPLAEPPPALRRLAERGGVLWHPTGG
jgi:GNAT superfamily N-acetyltransferase